MGSQYFKLNCVLIIKKTLIFVLVKLVYPIFLKLLITQFNFLSTNRLIILFMKKITLLMLVSLALLACKQKSSTDNAESADSTTVDSATVERAAAPDTLAAPASFAKLVNCDYYLPIKTLSASAQLAWLKAHKDEICANEDYLKCIVNQHTITETAYNDAVSAYWGTADPKVTRFPLSNFTDQACSFDKYYIFTANTTSHAITKSLLAFDVTKHGYSIAFFKGLPLQFTGITGDPDLVFTEGRINSVNTIVFYIDGITGAYFDFSKTPCGVIN